MDTILQAIVMGIVQGLTEFLPISSSGHLVVIPYLLGWTNATGQPVPGQDPFITSLAFSVVLHLRTSGATGPGSSRPAWRRSAIGRSGAIRTAASRG
jgi:undecaprenyl pyrophosphate phosphatase UppP